MLESLNALKQNNCEIKLVLSILDRKLGGSEKLLDAGYKYSSIFEINSEGEIV